MKRLRAAAEIAAETIVLTVVTSLVLGGVYGALALITWFAIDEPIRLENIRWFAAITTTGVFAVVGVGLGIFVGMMSGVMAGLLNGIITAVAYFPLTESNVHRFRRTITAAEIISTTSMTLLFAGIILPGLGFGGARGERPATLAVLVLEAGVTAGLGAWWVAGLVLAWYEGDWRKSSSWPAETEGEGTPEQTSA